MAIRSRRYWRLLLVGFGLWIVSTKLPSLFLRISFSANTITQNNKRDTRADWNSENDGSEEKIMPLERNAFEEYAPARKGRGRHTFRPDGLVAVNPKGPHPIFELVDRAEKAWNEKLRKASTSLDEAIGEYRRRYRRNPPKGFDKWWEYVQKHDVQLPDEYDTIYHDFEPFWGLEPSYLLGLQAEREFKKDTYTIGRNADGKLDVVKTSFNSAYDQLLSTANKVLDILRDIEDELPSFRATFTPHDGPNLMTDFVVKSTLLEAASTNSYVGREQLPPIHHLGWLSACGPTSPARRIDFNLDGPRPPKPKKSFIYNHRLTMDPCLNPTLLWVHGQFVSHNMGPDPYPTMIPEFSSCSTTLHHNLRFPTPYGWVEDVFPRSDDPDFADKTDERLLWRGTNTGIHHGPRTRWESAHRDILVRIVNEVNGTIDFLMPPNLGYEDQPVENPKTARRARINPAMMDAAFVRGPSQCEEPTCSRMKQIYEYKQTQSMKDAGNYKYVLDIDGNGWSGRFKRLITSNSLVFKTTIYPEWFIDRVEPWVHYIPVQVDLSDLYDSLIFFRGDPNGEGAHEELARQIALQGRAWSKKHWRREDIIAYFYRMLLEYARLMSLDREAMTYQGEGELHMDRWSKGEAHVDDPLLH
ncbi:glycosyl transferase family 90-domain-containing protein [Lentinula aciculospora]|uniref:Glycosyl transferase family 90-domain-containing protein n=1 Tax=Lentinula aciculospora TaxID=153920 RepID=A0A9W9A4S9_9AGAR|nr:glycosyl transferase family 90-domain-containing protein [Lentinula aciculospora]